jgi:hypothetical protein
MSKSLLILIGYFALTIMVILVTAGLVAYGQGYSYDWRHNRLTHNGLVIIDTSPSGATVKVQSKFGSKKTPYRASFEEGTYRFNVTKPGFEPWTKVLKVVASQVTLAEYVVLLPVKRVEAVLDRRPQLIGQTTSRDRRYMAYIVPGANGGLFTLDLTAGRPATRLYAPSTPTDPAQIETLTDVSWSDDATHLLLGSSVGGVRTVRLITASDGTQLNLTDKFHFDFTTLKFSGRDWRQMYWLSPEGLRRLDAGSQTVTGVLAEKVSQFVVAGDRILYVQTGELGESLGALDARDRKSTIIQALVKSPSYVIKYQSYQGQDLLAIVPSSNQTGTLYTNIFSSNPTARVVAQKVTDVIYSEDGHLATFYSPTKLVSYDFEQSGIFARSVSYSVDYPASEAISGLSYYDGYHLLLNQGGKLRFIEFDGQNAVTLGSIVPGSEPQRLMDQRSIITTSTTGETLAIKSISLR